MKNNILKSLFIVATVAAALSNSSCRRLEDFGDTNQNNNGPSFPITAGLLTSAEARIGDVVAGTQTGGNRGGLYAQYFSETQYPDASQYSEPKFAYAEAYNGVSYNFYSVELEDLQQIINRNSDPATAGNYLNSGSNANQIALATILKSYYIWSLTDRWGDVPYSEALQGTVNLTPKYDEQKDIYTKLLADLTAAVHGFDGGAGMKGDFLYGDAGAGYAADNTKWQRLGNTLRMFIALRMSKVDPATAATELNAAATDAAGIIEDNSDNLVQTYDGASFKNHWFNIYDGRRDYAYSQTMYDILNNMGDERNDVFGEAGKAPFPYGLSRDLAVAFENSVGGPNNWSRALRADFRAANSDLVIVNAATSLLAKAEGVARGWTAGDAEALYNEAVNQSYAQWGLGSASALLAGAANFSGGAGGGSDIGFNAAFPSVVGASANTASSLQRIQLQRYIASYPDGLQGWAEWKRTGVPDLKPTAFATNVPAVIPRRLVYGTNEYSLNAAQVALAVGRLTGGDVMNARMWWDTN